LAQAIRFHFQFRGCRGLYAVFRIGSAGNLAFFQCGLPGGAGAEGRALPGEEVVRHVRMGSNPSRHPVIAIAAYDDC
jgi:hypothetical protein